MWGLFLNVLFLFIGSSASGGSDRRKDREKNGDRKSPIESGGSETETASVVRATNMADRQLPPPPRDLTQQNQELNASRQSFRMAMGNPCEFFVDVM